MVNGLVSIVLISKGESPLDFKRALESVLQQTYQNKEVIVLDANPHNSPASLSLQEDLAQEQSITLLKAEKEGTEALLRNFVLEKIQGEYLAFLRASEYWLPEKINQQIELLVANPTAYLSCANGLVHYPDDQYITEGQLIQGKNPTIFEIIKSGGLRKASQVVYKTKTLCELGGFDEDLELLMDLNFLLNLQDRGATVFGSRVLFYTEETEKSSPEKDFLQDMKKIMSKNPEIFLSNSRWSTSVALQLGRCACQKRLWYLAVLYFYLAFFYTPLYFVFCVLIKLFKLGRRGLRLSFLCLLAFLKGRKLVLDKGNVEYLARSKNYQCQDYSAEEFTSLPSFYFAQQVNLQKLIVPERIRVIKKGMFYNCHHLVSIVIPATVTHIEARAFQDCINLKELHFMPGSNLQSLGPYSFSGCRSLTKLDLPISINFLGSGAFHGCENLKYINFPQGLFPSALIDLPPYLFAGCLSLRQVVFEPGSVLRRIGRGAFLNCRNLTTLEISGAIQSIGALAFYNCQGLENFGMPLLDAVQSIGHSAFYGCAQMSELQVPHALKKIKRRTFYACSSAEEIVIPERVRLVGSQAFARCDALKEVVIMNELTRYRKSSFPKHARITIYRST